MNILFAFWSKFKTWKQTKVHQYKQPLTRENAYSLSVIDKIGTYDDVLEYHKKWILETIKAEARMHNSYLLWRNFNKVTPKQRKELIASLSELGYRILYTDDIVMLITWLSESNNTKNDK